MKKADLTQPLIVGIMALICGFLWGSASPCIKIGYELFQIPADDFAGRILFAGYRFFMAGIMVAVLGSLIEKKALWPKKTEWKYVFIQGAFQTVLQYIFFYTGLAHASGVKSAIINASNSFITILLAVYLFRLEKMTRNKLIGGLVCMTGVILINVSSGGMDTSVHLNGEGALLLSSTMYAISSGFLKIFSSKMNTVTLCGYQFIAGGIVLSVAGWCMGGWIVPTGFAAIILIIYMAMISAVAYTLWGILLKYNPVAKVSVYGFTTPFFGVILSAFFLGETSEAFGPRGIAALLLVCAGIYLVNGQKEPGSR